MFLNIVFNGVTRSGNAIGVSPIASEPNDRPGCFAVMGVDDGRPELSAIEEQLPEADLVEGSPLVVRSFAVHPLRIGEQLQDQVNGRLSLLKLVGTGIGEFGGDGLPLASEPPDLLGEFVGGPVGISDELDALILSKLDLPQLPLEFATQGRTDGSLGFERAGEFGLDPIGCGLADGQGRPVVLDALLNGENWHARKVALAIGPAQTQVVEVEPPGLGLRALQREKSLAAGAPNGAFKVVLPLAITSPGVPLPVEHLLHLLEQLGRDDRLVAAVVLASLVGDLSEVVPILEDLPDRMNRQITPGRICLCRPRPQPRPDRCLAKLHEGELAGGVLLEKQSNQMCPLRIGDDCPYRPSFDGLGNVQVPEPCPIWRAAALGLGFHLVGDVVASGARLVLVHHVQDPGQHVAGDRISGGVLDRQEGNPELLQFPAGERGVGGIAEDSRPHVDDDRVDIPLLADALHHLVEPRPAIDVLGRSTRLYIFLNDSQPELAGQLRASLPLGRDGVALGVIVGVDLLRVGDSQVQHRASAPGHLAALAAWLDGSHLSNSLSSQSIL